MEYFKVLIELGNDAMQTTEDIIFALEQVIDKVKDGKLNSYILDENGNPVGNFDFTN